MRLNRENRNSDRVGAWEEWCGAGPLVVPCLGDRKPGAEDRKPAVPPPAFEFASHALQVLAAEERKPAVPPPPGGHKGPHPTSTPLPPLRERTPSHTVSRKIYP